MNSPNNVKKVVNKGQNLVNLVKERALTALCRVRTKSVISGYIYFSG